MKWLCGTLSEGYTEENIRMFILAYNKRVVEADLEIGADCSVLSKREITEEYLEGI